MTLEGFPISIISPDRTTLVWANDFGTGECRLDPGSTPKLAIVLECLAEAFERNLAEALRGPK